MLERRSLCFVDGESISLLKSNPNRLKNSNGQVELTLRLANPIPIQSTRGIHFPQFRPSCCLVRGVLDRDNSHDQIPAFAFPVSYRRHISHSNHRYLLNSLCMSMLIYPIHCLHSSFVQLSARTQKELIHPSSKFDAYSHSPHGSQGISSRNKINQSITSSIFPTRPPSFLPFITIKPRFSQFVIDGVMSLTHPRSKLISVS